MHAQDLAERSNVGTQLLIRVHRIGQIRSGPLKRYRSAMSTGVHMPNQQPVVSLRGSSTRGFRETVVKPSLHGEPHEAGSLVGVLAKRALQRCAVVPEVSHRVAPFLIVIRLLCSCLRGREAVLQKSHSTRSRSTRTLAYSTLHRAGGSGEAGARAPPQQPATLLRKIDTFLKSAGK